MMRRFFRIKWCASGVLMLLVLGAGYSQAQVASLVFERADIKIESPPPPADAKEPPTIHPILKYNIEVRAQDALQLDYIHTLNTLTPTTGVMIEFEGPSIAALPMMNVYTPIDALFVADDGTIVQIMPSIVLGETSGSIQAQQPVKAFLFLKDGEAAARSIRPRDKITGRMFTPLPNVQN
ncbi:MAG: DUF192 domain-containing protein [Rickettsiales bacterium]